MRLIIVSFSFTRGGAGIAANNFKQLLLDKTSGFEIDSVSQDSAGKFHFIKRLISYVLGKLQYDGNPIKHSLNLFSYSPLIKSFKNHQKSIYHFHWINNDTLSVFDLDRVPKGSILTLHDEWLYCGAEHCYKVLDNENEFAQGYKFFKKHVYGLNWNYLIWCVKKNRLAHRDGVIYTVPSKWMLERAKSSVILKGADIRYLPNPIDTETFFPMSGVDVKSLRIRYSIHDNDVVVCFGAIGGKSNYLKGSVHLDGALEILRSSLTREQAERIKLIDFGGTVSSDLVKGFRSISLGYINDSCQLALLYSAVDCVVVPSMVESFGQVAAESLSCGTPVVCFDTSGLIDMVLHKKTGLVAEAFKTASLADQILNMIEMSDQERKAMGRAGREHIVANFSFPVVSKSYFNVLSDAKNIIEYMS